MRNGEEWVECGFGPHFVSEAVGEVVEDVLRCVFVGFHAFLGVATVPEGRDSGVGEAEVCKGSNFLEEIGVIDLEGAETCGVEGVVGSKEFNPLAGVRYAALVVAVWVDGA